MSTPDHLLVDSVLPAFACIDPAQIESAVDALLAEYRSQIDALVAAPGPRTWDALMQPLEELEDRLARAWAPVSHLHSVCDSQPLRTAHAAALEKITELETELGQNRGLYEAVRALRAEAGFSALAPAQQRIVDESLRDFRLSGVALEEPARSRFRQIECELSKLATEYEQAVLDATDAWSMDIALADRAQLAGLPDSALALLQQNAVDAKREGWRINLQQPSYVAVMTHAEDRALRERVYQAYATRASDQGPHAGRHDNSERIEAILALRHEAARALGFANAAEESLVTKMADAPEKVLAFLNELARRARPVAQAELEQLCAFAADQLGLPSLQAWT